MSYEDLKDALDGLFAYDTGCTDSGIKDEVLRGQVKTHLRSLPVDEHRALVAKLTVDMWLSEKALEQGYGAEDAKAFLTWLDEEMTCLISA